MCRPTLLLALRCALPSLSLHQPTNEASPAGGTPFLLTPPAAPDYPPGARLLRGGNHDYLLVPIGQVGSHWAGHASLCSCRFASMVCERVEGSGSLVYLLVRVCQVTFGRMAEACTMERPGRSLPAVRPHNFTPSPARPERDESASPYCDGTPRCSVSKMHVSVSKLRASFPPQIQDESYTAYFHFLPPEQQ